MAYKDKDRQREYQRQWVRQKRAEMNPEEFKIRTQGTFVGSTLKGQTPGITICQGITEGVLTKEQQVSKQGFNA